MSTTWQTEAVKPAKVAAPAWRKGARKLAKRFGTGDIMCAEDPNVAGRWAITQSYALRFFEPDTIEAQAVTMWRDNDWVVVGIDDDGARVAAKVYKGGKNDMTPPEVRYRAPTWDAITNLFPDMDGNHVAVTELVPVTNSDGSATEWVNAMDADGNMLARFTTTILQGVLDIGETLLVNPDAPMKPAVIVNGDTVLGLVMPVRVP